MEAEENTRSLFHNEHDDDDDDDEANIKFKIVRFSNENYAIFPPFL